MVKIVGDHFRMDPGSVYRELFVYMWMDRTVLSEHVVILLVLVYVIYTLTSVPDDDPRKGSKHVGLVYRDCNV
jgi:hypothetical protein